MAEIQSKGRCLLAGFLQVISLPVHELLPIAVRHTEGITKMAVDLLASLSSELSRDIHEHGIILTGGSAAITLVRSALAKATRLNVTVAPDAENCVALGLQKVLVH